MSALSEKHAQYGMRSVATAAERIRGYRKVNAWSLKAAPFSPPGSLPMFLVADVITEYLSVP